MTIAGLLPALRFQVKKLQLRLRVGLFKIEHISSHGTSCPVSAAGPNREDIYFEDRFQHVL